MNIWIWTSPFETGKHLPLLAKVAAMGAEVVEFNAEPDAVYDAPQVRQALADHGLAASVVGMLGGPAELASPDASVRGAGVELAKRTIDLYTGIGGSLITATAGVGGKGYLDGAVRQSVLGRLAEACRAVGDHAQDAGMRFAYEVCKRPPEAVLRWNASVGIMPFGSLICDVTGCRAVRVWPLALGWALVWSFWIPSAPASLLLVAA